MKRQDIPKDIPEKSGIYFFKKGKDILYIGKATNLKDRVKSYFSQDISETRGPKIEKMLELVDNVSWEETDSVLEALILESNLIKKNQPEYNTREKDNKSYNYIVVTNEDFPRIFTVRERELLQKQKLNFKVKKTFGPYPNGNILREALRIVRKIFPFRDKKAGEKSQSRFYEMLALSPGIDNSQAKKGYQQTIKHISLLFEGKKTTILNQLEKEMLLCAKELRFEEAEKIKRKIFALRHIRDIALIKEDLESPFLQREKEVRIEAYDVAHLAGTSTVGVMTVVVNGVPDKSQYRKFKIHNDMKGSDTHALEEMLERRLAHVEWLLPDYVVVDGGTAQKRVAEGLIKNAGYNIPVISVVKDHRHKPKELRGQAKVIQVYKKAILLANNEAHRFAVEYHKNVRGKNALHK